MQEPRLQLFNLEGFLNQINLSLKNKDDIIELGEYKPGEIKRSPLLYRLGLNGRKIETRGEYSLTQKVEGRGVSGAVFTYDSEFKIGRVFVETGFVDANDGWGCDRYELLELRIKSPIELANGNRIPKCKIVFSRRTSEWAEPSQEREDYVMYGFVPVRDDLSAVLPTSHF